MSFNGLFTFGFRFLMKAKNEMCINYKQAVANLKNGTHSLGHALSDDLMEDYKTSNHPLESIIYCEYFATQMINYPESDDNTVEHLITPLFNVIIDAIETLSVEELLEVRFDVEETNKRISLPAFLALIGEKELFQKAFNKMYGHLSVTDLIELYNTLLAGYEGSPYAENLGLSHSMLMRGDVCYFEMAQIILQKLTTDQLTNLLTHFVKLHDQKEVYRSKLRHAYSEEDFVKVHSSIVPNNVALKKIYQSFVSQFHNEHLLWGLTLGCYKLIKSIDQLKRNLTDQGLSSGKILNILKAANTFAQESHSQNYDAALSDFITKCESIMENASFPALNYIKTFTGILCSVLSFLAGFSIGFAAGLWSGPGAFISGLITGTAATMAVTGVSVVGGITGGLAIAGFFKTSKDHHCAEALKDFTTTHSAVYSHH